MATTPPLTIGVITRFATVARRREVEARMSVNVLARYIKFLWEEECLVEHAKSLIAAVAATEAAAMAWNAGI